MVPARPALHMLHWAYDHRVLLYWLTAASVVVFVASLVLIPAVVIRIPPDYFAHARRPPGIWVDRHPILRMTLWTGKNALGLTFIVAGLAMLVLPGQGLLTIFIGFLMLDLPGKYRVEKWLVSRRRVLGGLNWLRRRAGRDSLRISAPS